MPVKYYIIAGEASGDLHGANLIKALRAEDPNADIRCWGGDKMAAAGGHVVKHIRELAFMGFIEVIKHLPTILGNISFCKQDILEYKPDVVILIDYPGFNFRLFKFIKQHGFKLFYYISPQLWAWKEGRVKQVKEYVDRMFVIFPFEKAFYAKHGVEVDFVGHPLLDELGDRGRGTGEDEFQGISQIIALLPGSRKQEIKSLLPEYLKVIPHFPDYKFVVAGISGLGRDFYTDIIGDARCEIEWDNTYGLLNSAHAAIVTSGTATLETALHNVPEVICYKASPLSYYIAKRLIKGIEYIGIVNLIAGRLVSKELIQADVNDQMLILELERLLYAPHRAKMLQAYNEVRQLLGSSGASERAAKLMIGYLGK
ncbi:MAG: lipiD-a-disaccharide synthase [Bacteroidetes bacterium]|nr:lipiD-a-disaccharide synthase [Bacteroidota bacterium]